MTVAKLKAVVVLCLLAATAYSAYRYRFRLDAFAWHVLHGSSTTVGGYRVEVPQDWFVEQDSPNDAQLWNARTGESVWVHSSPKPAHFSLQLWSELIRSRQNRPENRIIAERTLRVAGEPFLCFERDYVPKLPSAASAKALTHTIHLPGVECESAGPLQVMFLWWNVDCTATRLSRLLFTHRVYPEEPVKVVILQQTVLTKKIALALFISADFVFPITL